MIRFDNVSFRYSADSPRVLRDIDLRLDDGQLVLVAGPTGSGKSTLLGAINGHVPHFTGGILSGRVTVDGVDTAAQPPRQFAELVGMVRQDPLTGFVTDVVEEELAYGMEQLGVEPRAMRARVEETLDILGLADIRGRALRTLSGGQQQRVAIGAVLATGVRVLVLDEPTSALDPVSSEEVLATVLRLVHDIGLTVVIAEHRLERVAGYADQMILLDGAGGVVAGDTPSVMAISPLVPPVVELGRVAEFPTLPLSVRQARRMSDSLRLELAELQPEEYPRLPTPALAGQPSAPPQCGDPAAGLTVKDLSVVYGRFAAVTHATLDFPAGSITVLMGRNGSGKSSLLWALTGVQPIAAGSFAVDGTALEAKGTDEVRRYVRLVPQNAGDLLYLDSVEAECAEADMTPGSCRRILDKLTPGIDPSVHPNDLSEGQKLSLVLAIQLAAQPAVILLDEPTRGLDYPTKAALAKILRRLADEHRVVVVVTHDVEFAAEVADRIAVMAAGEVIQTGTATQILAASALFAPQVAKVLYPSHWLTPYQVEQALAWPGGTP